MTPHFDVAIVGGGISGLYTAWRLATQKDGPPLKVCLHECSDRLGGRIHTVPVPDTPDTRVELGAMRFPPSHEMVGALLKELSVETEPFPGQDFLHMYLRGRALPLSTAPGPPQPVPDLPFRLTGTEPSHPFLLAAVALVRIVPGIQLTATGFQTGTPPQPITTADWDRILSTIEVDGRPLWQWGFWNLLNRVVSNEAYEYLLAAFGVESTVSNWNAFCAVRLLCTIFGDAMNSNLQHPVGGWGELVQALETALAQLSNCTLVKSSKLLQVDKDAPADAPFVLTFEDAAQPTDTPPHRGPFITSTIVKVEATNLVLALPVRALELVNFNGLNQAGAAAGDMGRELMSLLLNVIRVPAFRIYVNYATPWWQQWCGWSSGYTVTDLPLRQVFYGFGLSGPHPAFLPTIIGSGLKGLDGKFDSSVLMATYSNAVSAEFWSGLLNPGEFICEFSGSDANLHLPLRDAVNRQLQELHGYEMNLPAGTWTCAVDWSADPFGAAWHAWRPNVDITKEIVKMRKPLYNVRLFLCGEAFSHVQGWIEGAICNTEMMLQEHFHLKQAAWIPAGYPLGPGQPAASATTTNT
ncbi:MAG: FAD-dependent oxidoreductase [Terriglobia bacterium]